VELLVPLKVDVTTGPNWGSCGKQSDDVSDQSSAGAGRAA
jgi:hypothetical protein